VPVLNVINSGINGSFTIPHETLSCFVQIAQDFQKVGAFRFFTELIEAYCNKYFLLGIQKK
jgi:hypothetical protein